jgi:hypothetical protein
LLRPLRNAAGDVRIVQMRMDWLANWILELAQLVEPQRAWRILKSDKHSTVWDGVNLLFDFNFQAFGVPPKECFELAALHATSREFPPGEHAPCYLAEHFKHDVRRILQERRARIHAKVPMIGTPPP